jgi:hypothetical protein
MGKVAPFKIFGLHAQAVVPDPYEGQATFLDLNLYLLCLSVKGVFHQFLHHRGRSFDHLSSGDLAGHFFREDLDLGHGQILKRGCRYSLFSH